MKPVASMTGFAVATRPTAIGPVAVELKSVNSRFLDLSVRYPDELRSVEAALRETISARVARGKVECRLGISRVAVEAAGGAEPGGPGPAQASGRGRCSRRCRARRAADDRRARLAGRRRCAGGGPRRPARRRARCAGRSARCAERVTPARRRRAPGHPARQLYRHRCGRRTAEDCGCRTCWPPSSASSSSGSNRRSAARSPRRPFSAATKWRTVSARR